MNAPAIPCLQRGQRAHEGRLAGVVGSEQAVHAHAFGYIESDVLESLNAIRIRSVEVFNP